MSPNYWTHEEREAHEEGRRSRWSTDNPHSTLSEAERPLHDAWAAGYDEGRRERERAEERTREEEEREAEERRRAEQDAREDAWREEAEQAAQEAEEAEEIAAWETPEPPPASDDGGGAA